MCHHPPAIPHILKLRQLLSKLVANSSGRPGWFNVHIRRYRQRYRHKQKHQTRHNADKRRDTQNTGLHNREHIAQETRHRRTQTYTVHRHLNCDYSLSRHPPAGSQILWPSKKLMEYDMVIQLAYERWTKNSQ